MPALTTRKDARERLLKLFEDSLNRFIPAEETEALRGQTFHDFEVQVDAVRQAILPALLEERAALESTALVENAGRCPHCGSDRVYLEKGSTKKEIISPHGSVVMEMQRARCRCCDRSFSPSGAGVGIAGRSAADASGSRTTGAGGNGAAV
jgi:hypothetical protein